MPDKFTLRRVYLNSGGYDASGSYWGIGAPLYYWQDHTGGHSGHVRAWDRDRAKAHIRKLHPDATFYR